MRIVSVVTIITLGFAHMACSSAEKKPVHNLPQTSMSGPVDLKIGAKQGAHEAVRYRSSSVSESFEEGAIRLRQESGVEFVARFETLKADDAKVLQVVTTADKEGETDLRTMAMPEVGERLELGMTRKGQILLAGGYPQKSIFFVPQVSLPDDKVQVGDTWDMQAEWVTLDEGVPFAMDMVSILKGFVKCGNETCADVEMSGEVRLQGSIPVGFKNEWTGRMLFAVGSGTTVWSHVVSREDYAAEAVQRVVTTCLETVMEEPAALKPSIPQVCKSTVKPETPPSATPAPTSGMSLETQTL
jgi:hypothetical protein